MRVTRSRLRFQLIQVFYFSSTLSPYVWTDNPKLNKGLFFQPSFPPYLGWCSPVSSKILFSKKRKILLDAVHKKRMWHARGLTGFPSSPLLINRGFGFMFSHSYFYDNSVHTYGLYQALTNKLKSPYGNRAEGDLEGDGMVHA